MHAAAKRVVVLGSFIHAHCLGVAQLPAVGASVAAHCVWHEYGGKGLNVALGLHRLGVPIDLVMAIGPDAAGREVCDFLTAQGIATDAVLTMQQPSGFGVGLIDQTGQNVIAIYRGANAALAQQHIQALAVRIQSSALVYAQFEIEEEPILAAFQLARQSHCTTVLNPSPWQPISASLLALTDILILNEIEAQQWLGLAELPPTAQAWLACLSSYQQAIATGTDGLVIVTLGAEGCVALQQGQEAIHWPAYPIQAVDPTGAGDAFSAAFVCAWLQALSLPECLAWGNAGGACVASQQGILAALPTQQALRNYVG